MPADSNYLWTVVTTAIGAFIAIFVAEIVKSFFRSGATEEKKRDEKLEEILGLIDDLRETGAEYWANDAKKLTQKLTFIEGKILGEQHYLSACVAALIKGKSEQICDVYIGKLFEALTGGDFGVPDRKKSKQQVTQVHLAALKLRHEVKYARSDLPRIWFK